MLRATAPDIQQWMREAANLVNQIPWRFVGPKTAQYTADYGECVLVDTTGGGFRVLLPKARDGAKVAVKEAAGSANAITVRLDVPGDLVEGGVTMDMITPYQAITFYADNGNWWAL